MRKLQMYRWLVILVVLLTASGLLASPVLAQTTPTPTEAPIPTLALNTRFPVLNGQSGDSFSFSVEMSYTGAVAQRFNVLAVTPPNWTAEVQAGFQPAAVVALGPSDSLPATETLSIRVVPSPTKAPDPGDYTTTVTVDSGSLKQEIILTARVTARYGLSMSTDSGKLNADATAGKDTHVAVRVLNVGTAPIQNVTFTSTKPEGWTITFNPDRVDTIPAGFTQQVDVVINPPSGKAIAGDYAVNLGAQGDKGSSSIDMRVTVLTPTIWGWLGIIIVLLVIAGLAVLFKVLGRR